MYGIPCLQFWDLILHRGKPIPLAQKKIRLQKKTWDQKKISSYWLVLRKQLRQVLKFEWSSAWDDIWPPREEANFLKTKGSLGEPESFETQSHSSKITQNSTSEIIQISTPLFTRVPTSSFMRTHNPILQSVPNPAALPSNLPSNLDLQQSDSCADLVSSERATSYSFFNAR